MTQTAAATIPTRTITLDASLRDEAIARIVKANRRAERLGLTPYRYAVGETTTVPMFDDETILRGCRKITDPDGVTRYVRRDGTVIEPDWYREMITLTLVGATPALPGGWVILGMVDLDPAMGPQLRLFADNAGPIDRAAHTGGDWQDCHHCHKPRNRSKMFLLRSRDGELVRVGTTCLGAGFASPALG